MRGEGTGLTGVLFWILALCAMALARAPYLTSPLYILDNDEAVLGIMARQMAAGEAWPLFFVGQNYGLAIFETAPVALAFSLFGASASVLTGTVLTLFLLSLIVWAKALERISGSRAWARTLVLVLAMTPGWVVWSTKARGLYVAGFALTGVATLLLCRRRPRARELLTAAALSGIIALVQPLWLVVLFPFWLTLFWSDGDGAATPPRSELAIAGVGAFVLWALPTWMASGREAFWQPDFVQPRAEGITAIPVALYRAFAGVVAPSVPIPAAALVGRVATAAFFLVMCAVAVQAMAKRSRRMLAVAVAMVLSVGHAMLLQYWVPRYFLPATVLLFVAGAVWIGHRRPAFGRLGWAGGSIALVVLGWVALGLGQPPRDSVLGTVSAREDLELLVRGLASDGVEGVYAAHSDVQWQIMFYGDDMIPTRGRSKVDRYPAYVEAVDRARSSGGTTALVADVRRLRDEIPELGGFPGYRVGERYLRLDDPSDAALALLRFDFEPLEQEGTGAMPPPM